ncbi:unnamed protein product [Acanthoscelides obtectus]|uniref:Uncharacterized protein n=1 Tax=Acanthoscelides obtectus TaxID=200917 RepID=A0A9P0Q865_ACAOB|nr:unnamed protein product [Acanthoscelides obtectus]CAK1676199.1 hypothetical protein AOBTE_LOCUS30645 [Acanthoscelides obtectus]
MWLSNEYLLMNDASHFVHESLAPVCFIIWLAKFLATIVLYSQCLHSCILLDTEAVDSGCFCKMWFSNDCLLINDASHFVHLRLAPVCFIICIRKCIPNVVLYSQCMHS